MIFRGAYLCPRKASRRRVYVEVLDTRGKQHALTLIYFLPQWSIPMGKVLTSFGILLPSNSTLNPSSFFRGQSSWGALRETVDSWPWRNETDHGNSCNLTAVRLLLRRSVSPEPSFQGSFCGQVTRSELTQVIRFHNHRIKCEFSFAYSPPSRRCRLECRF